VSGFSDDVGRGAAGVIEDENFWVSGHSVKMLWERFSTAINLLGSPSKIVVENHSHQPLTSA